MSDESDPKKKTVCILTYKQVRERIPLSRVHIGRLERQGRFPKRLYYGGGGRCGWLSTDIDAYVLSCAARRRD